MIDGQFIPERIVGTKVWWDMSGTRRPSVVDDVAECLQVRIGGRGCLELIQVCVRDWQNSHDFKVVVVMTQSLGRSVRQGVCQKVLCLSCTLG